jgi:hypothetical protein
MPWAASFSSAGSGSIRSPLSHVLKEQRPTRKSSAYFFISASSKLIMTMPQGNLFMHGTQATRKSFPHKPQAPRQMPHSEMDGTEIIS